MFAKFHLGNNREATTALLGFKDQSDDVVEFDESISTNLSKLQTYHMEFHISNTYATIRSGSIAIAASTLDSLLHLLAGGILWYTHIAMKNINIYQYPIGKLRVQPAGIIVFAAVMATPGQ